MFIFIVLAAVPYVNTCCGVSVETSLIWTIPEPRALQCLQNPLIHIPVSQYSIYSCISLFWLLLLFVIVLVRLYSGMPEQTVICLLT